MKFYGIATGDTGNYGVGDIVVGTSWTRDENTGTLEVDGEPCYNVFTHELNGIRYVEEEKSF